LDVDLSVRLDIFDERTRSLDVFSDEDVLIVNIEDQQKSADNQRPLWKETQSPLKRDSVQETEIQGRISQRRQQSAGIADNENEKYGQMCGPLPHMVGAQVWPDQKHGRARRANQVCKNR